MVAALASGAANLSTVQVKGQVTLKTGTQGAIDGSLRIGAWLNNAWDPATLSIASTSSTLGWMAPMEVIPGSQVVLNGGAGSITLAGLVWLRGWGVNGVNTFASLVSHSGTNAVDGGIALGGPGRIAVTSNSLAINRDPQVASEAVYPTQATYQTDRLAQQFALLEEQVHRFCHGPEPSERFGAEAGGDDPASAPGGSASASAGRCPRPWVCGQTWAAGIALQALQGRRIGKPPCARPAVAAAVSPAGRWSASGWFPGGSSTGGHH
jgi:hypothetical protein